MKAASRTKTVLLLTSVLTLALGVASLLCGSVDIPADQVWAALFGDGASKTTWQNIIVELRLPMAVTAALGGMALAVAGLLMQTAFDNPLAGPSIMGVSSGASLGVAVVVMLLGSSAAGALGGALAGAAAVIAILVALSSVVRSTLMLLIVGILVGYLTSSVISLLNYFATREMLQAFVLWGLGTFGDVAREDLGVFSAVCLLFTSAAFLMIKPLNAMLLGDRYAESMGVSVRRSRTLLLVIAGALTAAVTAWCGPIAFIGLVVPHVARMAVNTSDHTRLLPATALAGAFTGELTLWLSVLPWGEGSIPVNAITPVLGVPVILYIIIFRRKLNYFN